MKVQGKTIVQREPEVIVIPRKDGEIIFQLGPVLDYDEHDKVNPMPSPPVIRHKGSKEEVPDYKDKKYLANIDQWATNKTHWMFLKSMESTEGLEWETVKMTDPTTWKNYRKEMEQSGLSGREIEAILSKVIDACGLNDKKIQEATDSFLLRREEAEKEESQENSQPIVL